MSFPDTCARCGTKHLWRMGNLTVNLAIATSTICSRKVPDARFVKTGAEPCDASFDSDGTGNVSRLIQSRDSFLPDNSGSHTFMSLSPKWKAFVSLFLHGGDILDKRRS